MLPRRASRGSLSLSRLGTTATPVEETIPYGENTTPTPACAAAARPFDEAGDSGSERFDDVFARSSAAAASSCASCASLVSALSA